MPDDLRVSFEPFPTTADEDFVKNALGQWNVRVTGFDDYAPAYHFLRDRSGAIRGAVLAYVWARWLHVDTVWVADDLRRQGWASMMLHSAHDVGRSKGAEASFLDTFSWQARPFYERLGYAVVAEVPMPSGYNRYYMVKSPL